MEYNISDELRLAELKKENLRKSFDQAYAQTSSILLFTLQWKDLENHLDLAKKGLEKRSQEIELHEKELMIVHKERAKELELKENEFRMLKAKVEECCGELELKQKQLDSVGKWVEECTSEFKLKERELNSVRKLVEDCSVELSLKRKELSSVQKSIQECCGELEMKEKQLDLVEKWVEECTCKFKLKERELNSVRNSVQDCSVELSLKSKELSLVQKSIQECCVELQSKEKKLGLMQKELQECCGEINVKKKHMVMVQKAIQDCTGELESNAMMKSIRECNVGIESKERNLEMIEQSIQKQSAKLHSKKKKLDSLQKHVKQCAKELESKEEELDSVKEMVKEYHKDIELREREFNAIQMCVKEYNQELKSREKQIESIQMSIEESSNKLKVKEDQLSSIEKSIMERSEQLESKRKHADLMEKSVKEKSDELASKEVQLDSIERRTSESIKEFEVKQRHFDSLKKSLEERLEELEMKERKFGARLRELELKERQFDARVKECELKEKKIGYVQKAVEEWSKEVELKEKQLANSVPHREMTEQPENMQGNKHMGSPSASLQVSISKNGRDLQLLLNDHLKWRDSVHAKISDALNTSSDPAKLVLDAMQGFYPPHLRKGEEFDVGVIRRSCILLLEQVMIISPPIKPQVRGEAMKLASDWKSKMRVTTENSLEVSGFLHLLAAYNLASTFNVDELQNLLDIVIQCRQTPGLRKALGISDKAPVSNILPSQVKTEQLEHFPVSNTTGSPTANIQQNAIMVGKSFQFSSKEHDLMQNEVSTALQLSPDPAEFVLHMMQGEMNKHWKKGDARIEESLVKNCILLLEELMRISLLIKPEVKAEAVELAIEWKERLNAEAENSLEVLGFLQLLATYGLLSSFDRDEIFKLFRIVAQHKLAPEICRALGFADKILDFSRDLIERNQYMEAVRFICSFGLVDKCQAKFLLEEQLENIKRSMYNILKKGTSSIADQDEVDKAIAALRAILDCIADYKLETDIPSGPIEEFIVLLEKQKIDRRHFELDSASLAQLQSMAQTQLQGGSNQGIGTSALSNQPSSVSIVQSQLRAGLNHKAGVSAIGHQPQQQGGNKRPRVDVPILGAYTSQVATLTSPYMNFPALLHRSITAPNGSAQFGVAGNHYGIAENLEESKF